MSRLGGPEQPSSDERSSGDERRAGRSRTQKKDDDADGDGSPPVKPTGRNLGRRVAGSLLPPPGSFKPNEVLAVNLNAAGLARALQRNFKVLEKVEYPALGFNLTRLATPDTQNAIIGRSTLHEELPADGFGLNHIYAAGRATATVPSGTAPDSPDGERGKAPAVPSTPSRHRASTGIGAPGRAHRIVASASVSSIGSLNSRPVRGASRSGLSTRVSTRTILRLQASISSTKTSFRATARSRPTITERASFLCWRAILAVPRPDLCPMQPSCSATPSLLIATAMRCPIRSPC